MLCIFCKNSLITFRMTHVQSHFHVHLLNTQHIYKLQQYIIPFVLPSGQRTMHRGILNKKIIRPDSARFGP